jgi:hypothetical protein
MGSSFVNPLARTSTGVVGKAREIKPGPARCMICLMKQ